VRKSHAHVALAVSALTALTVSACSSNSSGSSGQAVGGGGGNLSASVAFLMPDQASTRYEQHDHPGFVAQMKKDCPKCTVLYNNADADASKQQQQFNSALTQGAKVVVLDPVDSSAAASLVQQAHSRGVKVIAYDRPITATQADYYVSFDNEKIGSLISSSLVQHLKSMNVPTTGDGLLEVNGSPTDAAAGLIKKGIHEGLSSGGYQTLAEYDTPDWEPAKAQDWVSGQVSRFHQQIVGVVAANDGTAGGTIAAFKAANVSPVPPITGNDATIAGLQQIISGDLYNTISKPSEIVAGAAADAAVQMLKGQKPTAATTVFNTPSKLFTPTVITQQNIKAEIVDKGIAPASQLCTPEYQAACAKLNLT
jgi:D-xylose transport system substrate-binding protein